MNDLPTLHAEDRIVRSLRRLLHVSDTYSRQLVAREHVTAPQLVCLRELARNGAMIPSVLARAVSLSQPTVTGICNRLEARGLVTRARDQGDRRRVTLRLTDAGTALAQVAPSPLHLRLAAGLARLDHDEQDTLADALDQVVAMLEPEGAERAPSGRAGRASAR